MDIELLRTFLEVNKTRHFGKAAANLYLTQAAVSARIRLLEQTVGVALFTRDRNDIQLTPFGRKLIEHAETILRSWTQARQELVVEDEHKSALITACVPGVWETLLERWIVRIRTEVPDLVLSAEICDTETVVRRLLDNTADLGLMFEAPESGDLKADRLGTFRFVLISDQADITANDALSNGYLYVNWGDWFSAAHAKHFREPGTPVLRLGSGRSAHMLILELGGCAYLPQAMVQSDLAEGRLHIVADAPVIERGVNAVYLAEAEKRTLVDKARGLLAVVAADYIST
jgi:DNA-binding transcriptional LysR family regulator